MTTPAATWTHSNNENVGTATAIAEYAGNSTYVSSSGTKVFAIGQAAPDCDGIADYTGAYDGDAHGAIGTCVGVDGEELAGLSLGASFTDVPGGTANWSIPASTNYTAANGTKVITINQAAPDCDGISGSTDIYDGDAHGAISTCVGVDGEELAGLSLGASFTDVPGGTANWSIPASTRYSAANGSVEIEISEADATCDISGYTGTYDATAHGATGTCKGIDGEAAGTLNLGDPFTNVPGGTATWTFTGNGNYTDDTDDTGTVAISKAPTTVTLMCPVALTYTGLAQEPCSATASGVGISVPNQLSVVYGNNTSAGVATADASWTGDTNHSGSSASDTFEVLKAASTTVVTCTGGPFMFTGTPYTPCTAAVTGVGGLSGSVTVNHSDNLNPGTANATATFGGDANHNGSTDTKTFQIAAWTLKGFYQPVDMNGVWNTVKGGSTVPLKFEVFAARLN